MSDEPKRERSASSMRAETMTLEAELKRFFDTGKIGPGLQEFYDLYSQTSPTQPPSAPGFGEYMQGQIGEMEKKIPQYDYVKPNMWGAGFFQNQINRLFPRLK